MNGMVVGDVQSVVESLTGMRGAPFSVYSPRGRWGPLRWRALNRGSNGMAPFFVVVAGCTAVAACTPAIAPAPPPSQTLTATWNGQACLVPGLAYEAPNTGKLVGVGVNPAGAVARWIPGMNVGHCSVSETRLTAAQAGRLAQDINNAPAFPAGVMHWPMDDATAVQLVFSYLNRPSEAVIVGLTGCAAVNAPGRSGRRMSAELRADLAAVAPPDWHTYLSP